MHQKSMHLINKRKGKERTKEKMHYKCKKICIKSLAVRAGSVRTRGLARGLAGRIKPPKSVRRFTVARFEYVPKPGLSLLPGGVSTTAAGKVCT